MKYRGIAQTNDMIEAHRDANAALWTSCSQRTVAASSKLSRSHTLDHVTIISGVDPRGTGDDASGSTAEQVRVQSGFERA